MDKAEEVKMFVYNLVYDVCEYFLQTIYHKVNGYLSPRALYFSEFGHNELLKFLKNGSQTFLSQLHNNKRLQNLNDVILQETVQNIIEASKWKQHGHSNFYELCGKLAVFRVFTEDRGYSSDRLIYEQLTKLATEGEELCILEVEYDRIRKFSVEVVYAVFKWHDLSLGDFVTGEDVDVDVEVPNHMVIFLESSGRALLGTFEKNDSLNLMNIIKFKIILHYFSRTYRGAIKSDGDEYGKVCELGIYIALLALHCAKVNYKEGIYLAFDAICYELSSYFKRPNAQKVKIV